MGEAAFWGAVGASALVVGAEVTFGFKLSRMVIGLIMAFGVGALISSVSFELVVPAMQDAETWQVALGLALGSLTFFAGDGARHLAPFPTYDVSPYESVSPNHRGIHERRCAICRRLSCC